MSLSPSSSEVKNSNTDIDNNIQVSYLVLHFLFITISLPFAGKMCGGKIENWIFFCRCPVSTWNLARSVCVHSHIFFIVVVVVVAVFIISLWSRKCHTYSNDSNFPFLSARVNQYTLARIGWARTHLFYNHLSIGGRYPPSQIVWHIWAHTRERKKQRPKLSYHEKQAQSSNKNGGNHRVFIEFSS